MAEVRVSSLFDIASRGDHVEVRGATSQDVTEALELLVSVRELRADQVRGKREMLLLALMATGVPVVPPASVAQTHRLAAHRDALLATPVLDHASLRGLRGDTSESGTRTWLARRRADHAVFTVSHSGRTLIPAFQLDEHGDPRPELRPVLTVLRAAGVDGWNLWTWLTSPSSYLSGQVPETVARTEPVRAVRAAERFAARRAA